MIESEGKPGISACSEDLSTTFNSLLMLINFLTLINFVEF